MFLISETGGTEFEDSPGYVESPCLKKKKRREKEKVASDKSSTRRHIGTGLH